MKSSRKIFFAISNVIPPSGRPLRTYNEKSWGFEADPAVASDASLLRWNPGRRRLFLAFLLFFIGVSTLFGRLAYLQIAHGASLRLAAEENRIRIAPLKAARGVIYDRRGTLLVQNVPNFIVEIVPGDLPSEEKLSDLAARLSTILSEDPAVILSELREKQTRSFRGLLFRDHLDYTTAMKLRLIERDLPGVHVVVSASREYLGGSAFSHLLGYTGNISPEELARAHPAQRYLMVDQIGKTGLERSYELTLRGIDGQKQIEVNAVGKEQRVIATEPPVLGKDLWLSIDANLQQETQRALDAAVGRLRLDGGAVVVMDVRNGEILALASSPTFDNNIFVRGGPEERYTDLLHDQRNPLFNRSVAGQYPPGSTIKPLLAAAGLEERVITGSTTVQSTGGITIGQWSFPDWKAGGHGVTDIRKAIAWSVNTFFYTLGGGTDTFSGLGLDRMLSYLREFGLGAKSGVDIPGEATGFLPSREWKETTKKEKWYIGDTYHLAIGQGDVLVTPLQMASATSTIANNGGLFQPHLVHAIGDSSRRTEVQRAAERYGFVSPSNLKIVREGMRQAVLDGSAAAVQNGIPQPVAAKTGTAQYGAQKATHAWFTAFAPYDDPQVALAVVVEGGGEGTATALPVARDVLASYFQLQR
ncbi:MAG: penicillin-binding protein 2 [Candidatus Kerfeldbacteria bacterium]|nr:penicillin-binding protein 2 [Candidatus Kerfeldbacteria bacterium]